MLTTTTIRVYPASLPKIESIKRRLTMQDGQPRTTPEVIDYLIDAAWTDKDAELLATIQAEARRV